MAKTLYKVCAAVVKDILMFIMSKIIGVVVLLIYLVSNIGVRAIYFEVRAPRGSRLLNRRINRRPAEARSPALCMSMKLKGRRQPRSWISDWLCILLGNKQSGKDTSHRSRCLTK